MRSAPRSTRSPPIRRWAPSSRRRSAAGRPPLSARRRHRADVVVWWGIDPASRYPRYAERYAPLPDRPARAGRARVENGARRWISARRRRRPMRIGASPCPREDEIATLTALRALLVRRRPLPKAARRPPPIRWPPRSGRVRACWRRRSSAGRYVWIVADGERAPGADPHADQARLSALIALAQAINGPDARAAEPAARRRQSLGRRRRADGADRISAGGGFLARRGRAIGPTTAPRRSWFAAARSRRLHRDRQRGGTCRPTWRRRWQQSRPS